MISQPMFLCVVRNTHLTDSSQHPIDLFSKCQDNSKITFERHEQSGNLIQQLVGEMRYMHAR